MSGIRNILLVEDDHYDQELILTALEEIAVVNNIDVVTNGEEALAYLRCQGKFSVRDSCIPAVVMLDLKLPGNSGFEVLKQIRVDETFKTIPIVILTSSGEERDIDEAYRLGANAFIVKPIDYIKFMAAIKAVGAFWAVLNEPPRYRQ
ncbi:MAG TPA: response regulator [Dissulfurispiraceae bacterium]|nr:response regulator [Dissulfurispiraceae bacterium]